MVEPTASSDSDTMEKMKYLIKDSARNSQPSSENIYEDKADVIGSSFSFLLKPLASVEHEPAESSSVLNPNIQFRPSLPPPVQTSVQLTSQTTSLSHSTQSQGSDISVLGSIGCSETESRPTSPVGSKAHSSPSVSSTNSTLLTGGPIPTRRPRHKPGERRELLTRAVEDVLNLKISMRRAAQKYNLAKSSLCDFVRKNKISLPNLRFKSCPSAPDANATTSAARIPTAALKRMLPDGEDASDANAVPSKVTCGAGRKLQSDSVVSNMTPLMFNANDGYENVHEQLLGRTGFGETGNTNSRDSWAEDEGRDMNPSVSENLFQLPRSATYSGNGPSSASSFPKSNRIESPWHNSAGLPTQVPMRSWSAHNKPVANTPAVSNYTTNPFDRKLPFNSLAQLRHTIEAQNRLIEHNMRSLVEETEATDFTSSSLSHSNLVENGPGQSLVNDLKQPGERFCNTSFSISDSRGNLIRPSSLQSDNSLNKVHFQANVVGGVNDSAENSNNTSVGSNDAQHIAALPLSCATSSDSVENICSFSETSTTSTPVDVHSLIHSFPANFPENLAVTSTNPPSSRNEVSLPSRSRDTRPSYCALDPSLDMSIQSNLTSAPDTFPNSITQPVIGGTVLSSIPTTPCPSLASILSTDFSSINQTAVASLLLHHLRSFQSGPLSVPPLPNLMGYSNTMPFPVSTPLNPNAQSLFSTDLRMPASPSDLSQTSTSSAARSATTRLSTGQSQTLPSVTSVLNHLATNLPTTDLLQQLNLDGVQQLFYRQLQPRLSTDLTTPSATLAAALAAQLLPHFSGQASVHSLVSGPMDESITNMDCTRAKIGPKTCQPNFEWRNLVANLLGSFNSKIPTSLSSTGPATTNSFVPHFVTENVNSNHDNSHHHPYTQTTRAGSQFSQLSPNEQEMNKIGPHARGLVDFINKSPSPFHAVQTACELLSENGFRELKEGDPWRLKPLDCVFLRKNGTTVMAAAIGGKFKPGNGFHLIGAHTDSPCLRLKPVSDRPKEGYTQLGVETYGGGLWYTWFDRELKVAGRAVLVDPSGRLEERLVHIDRPIACVPSLAIHLNQEVRSQGFLPNLEQHMAPILCTTLMDQVNHDEELPCIGPDCSLDPSVSASSVQPSGGSIRKRRHPAGLLSQIAEHLSLGDSREPIELELYLADYQPARIGGLHNEFVHAPRLDNLFNAYTGICGLVESLDSLPNESCLRIVCLYDHEEVGSTSAQGANSAHTLNILRRMAHVLATDKHLISANSDEIITSVTHFEESLSKSFLLSADQAHAVHPSYGDRHEANHKPQLHGGLVLKCNSNQRYATNALTAAVVRQVASLAKVPVQEFTPRQDMHCGTTIGPLLASQLGVPTADVGFAQLAMHSCRELCCTTSCGQAVQFYSTFFEQMPKIWPPN
ncbi:hypothetical protein EG68_09692 [Paragonimus skrjabini miyazakii]|uniref:Aspartyl aminopeptidase n=1 Tax=Paragonimus skrjabini miyazakii TaxID=59628 RepID=A0A8S9Y8X5_9TREM|nr:hypothetical protein EG68_09692 [Paragonimus skrjabini miyazakii]